MESYGGNLALSWDFQGEAEGFLVKAYVETLKGKLILAESKPVYLEKRQYGEPKVSMVIPAYNAEKYVARCIDTVLVQSQPDVEIIVVDDGSTDHTPEIIDWYAENYENVAVMHQENSGAAAARNTGMKNARGEYTGFADVDDMIRINMVERLYQAAKKNDCDIAITSVYMVTDSDYIKYLRYTMKEGAAIAADDFYHIYIYGTDLGVVVWNKLYRTSLIKKYMFPIIPYEDEAWTPYILSYANTVCYLNDFSYEWDRRSRNNSLSEHLRRRSKQEIFEQRKNAVLFFLDNGNPKKILFLKELAGVRLLQWENVFHYKEYGKLRDEIETDY